VESLVDVPVEVFTGDEQQEQHRIGERRGEHLVDLRVLLPGDLDRALEQLAGGQLALFRDLDAAQERRIRGVFLEGAEQCSAERRADARLIGRGEDVAQGAVEGRDDALRRARFRTQ
jgi:hypothetical protein